MAFDFPASPAENQEYSPAGGPTYVFKSPSWKVKSASSGLFVQRSGDTMSGPLTVPIETVTGTLGVGGVTTLENTLFAHADVAADGLYYEQGHRLVRKDGDTMTGALVVPLITSKSAVGDAVAGAGVLYVDTAMATRNSGIWMQDLGKTRWGLYKWGNAESTGNAGSDLRLDRLADDGVTSLGNALLITRSSGLIALGAGQLKFPATANPSSDVNTQDDYREGTFVPGMTFNNSGVGMGYATQQGAYVKIGNRVFFEGRVTLNAKGSGVGVVRITNLPFVSSYYGALHLYTYSNWSSITALTGYVEAGTDTILIQNQNPTNCTNLQNTNAAANSDIVFGGHYRTAL